MAEEYVPFEEALKSLKMSEEELKRLVSQDEIQAVRDATGSIRLRKEDVEKLVQSETAELADDLEPTADRIRIGRQVRLWSNRHAPSGLRNRG